MGLEEPPSSSPPPPHPAPRVRLSRGKKLAFAAFLLTLVFVTLELLVRIGGIGDPDAYGGSRLRVQWIFPPIFRETADRSGWRPVDVRLVDRFIPRARAGAGRIFVFGESAVFGLGFAENASFSRALERRIAAAKGPPTTVVNCGIPQIAARQVHLVEREVLRLRKTEPGPPNDVFVFYVGNNEFSSILAEKYLEIVHGGRTLPMRLDDAFEHSRLYTTFKSLSRTFQEGLTPAIRPIFPDAVLLPKPPRCTPDEVKAAVDAYAARLRAMVLAARDAGVKPVLATVVVNQEWDAREAPKGGWLADACGGAVPEDATERQAKLDAAEKAATATLARPGLTPTESWLGHLKRGHVRRALGKAALARQDFLDAIADDPYRLRCLPEMSERVRQLATELDVPLADCEWRIGEQSPDGIIGYGQVYDNCHLGLECAEQVAACVEETLTGAGLLPRLETPADYLPRRRALWSGDHDSLRVDTWIGWANDPTLPASRDGKKFITLRETLEKRAADGTATARELVWAGDGYALEPGGEAAARAFYQKALAKLDADNEVKEAVAANVAWLDARPK